MTYFFKIMKEVNIMKHTLKTDSEYFIKLIDAIYNFQPELNIDNKNSVQQNFNQTLDVGAKYADFLTTISDRMEKDYTNWHDEKLAYSYGQIKDTIDNFQSGIITYLKKTSAASDNFTDETDYTIEAISITLAINQNQNLLTGQLIVLCRNFLSITHRLPTYFTEHILLDRVVPAPYCYDDDDD